ncbi:leukocyte cell-derived chemotaxin-2-like [Dendronephthya gigantea]|uniref:leukocyte cell-derived chemotaxin-2-like n=1 Tax=Dendronephthya gigantea TaxID=151771 RepID=UPI00106CC7CA|nr:leukocyte cell-derived chemotaxin-2-like [Dendronephthya gigantea]
MVGAVKIVIVFLLLADHAVKCFKLGQLCSSNCGNTIRGCDSQGCGYYGAPRGSRTHKGVDIICSPGSLVIAPFSAKILRKSFPYSNNNEAYNNGLYIEGTGEAEGFRAKIFYFTPSKYSEAVKKGSMLGKSQALPYSGITQHLHLQLYKNGVIVNPQDYL